MQDRIVVNFGEKKLCFLSFLCIGVSEVSAYQFKKSITEIPGGAVITNDLSDCIVYTTHEP